MADSKQIANLAYGVLILVAGMDGLGHHVWDFTEAEFPKIANLLQVSQILGSYNLSCTKAAF